MCGNKARSLPLSGTTERWFSQVGFDLTHKEETRLERPTRDKRSNLFVKLIHYGPKKFYNIVPGA
jgi:hypothetical protein